MKGLLTESLNDTIYGPDKLHAALCLTPSIYSLGISLHRRRLSCLNGVYIGPLVMQGYCLVLFVRNRSDGKYIEPTGYRLIGHPQLCLRLIHCFNSAHRMENGLKI